MSQEALRIERDPDGFATVTLNRPDKLNTLSVALRRELTRAMAELEADPGVGAVILTGAGRAFTAGLDLDEWAAEGHGNLAEGRHEGAAAYLAESDAVAALQQFTGPVIGAINGLCVTGGLEIALACDLLLASSEARFADTHVKVGLLPGWGGSVRLQQRVGAVRAKELALTGRFFSAQEAYDWGLLNRVVPAAELLPAAQALARLIVANPPAGVAAYKRLLDEEAGLPGTQALAHERATSRANNLPVTRAEIDRRLALLRRQPAAR